MASSRTMTGTTLTTDCNWEVNGNTGCSVESTTADSFGPSFNTAGGGWYVIERTDSGISVWFWGRDSSPPSAVKEAPSSISSASFGTPLAYFPSSSTCSISEKFGENNIIFDLDFCGDWAANTYASSGCPGTCVDYVNANPTAFVDAYWLVNAVRVYT